MDWTMKKFTAFLQTGRKFYHRRMNEMEESASADQFKNQNEYTVQKGRDKNTFRRLVAVGIDIKSKYDGVGQQGNAADGGKQGFICFQQEEIIPNAERPGKIPEIINQHRQQGRQNAQHDAQLQVVFF
jgi:hypothetical protein